MDGGAVSIDWQRDNGDNSSSGDSGHNGHVVMTGPVAYVARGHLSAEINALLEAANG